MQRDVSARLVLLPREAFGVEESIHLKGLSIGWKYVGRIVPSVFRWDLYLILEEFFGMIPHCTIDAFLPSLQEVATGNVYKSTIGINQAALQETRSLCERKLAVNQTSNHIRQNNKAPLSNQSNKTRQCKALLQTKEFSETGKENQSFNRNQTKKNRSRPENSTKKGVRQQSQSKRFGGQGRENQPSIRKQTNNEKNESRIENSLKRDTRQESQSNQFCNGKENEIPSPPPNRSKKKGSQKRRRALRVI
jgi:hypothetical protein